MICLASFEIERLARRMLQSSSPKLSCRLIIFVLLSVKYQAYDKPVPLSVIKKAMGLDHKNSYFSKRVRNYLTQWGFRFEQKNQAISVVMDSAEYVFVTSNSHDGQLSQFIETHLQAICDVHANISALLPLYFLGIYQRRLTDSAEITAFATSGLDTGNGHSRQLDILSQLGYINCIEKGGRRAGKFVLPVINLNRSTPC